ncbi:MAG TPA: NRDE family protein [Candidatus Binatia bacterium]|jgi:uncharacterized protein with NRDE domain|nr:NRDE family protein [Candidatus Binatia bacterium]
MCTILLRLDPGAAEPVVLGANRDEFRARPTDDPMVIVPGVFAGRDREAGGTWLAVGRGGLAAITNISAAPRVANARSRGALPLAALDGTLPRDYHDYNAFNLLVVDAAGARVLTHLGEGHVEGPVMLGPGTHVIVNEPFGVGTCTRAERARSILDAHIPDFDLLADHGPPEGLCHHGETYGTVSSTVVALDAELRVVRYLHRPGLPCVTPTQDLTAAASAPR